MEDINDTPKCTKCAGSTALITGNFNYSPHEEPYQSGVKEDAATEKEGECFVAGYKCDNCGNIQGLWAE